MPKYITDYAQFVTRVQTFEKFEAVSRRDKTQKFRCMRESNCVFVYAKGKSRRGYRYSYEDFFSKYAAIVTDIEDKEKAWKRKLRTCEKRLEQSGLWPEIRTLWHNLQKMSYADWQLLKSENKAQLMMLRQKYPFVFMKDGKVDWNYLGELADPKTKSMYFGYENKQIKERIKEALDSHTDYHTPRITVNYDVTFEYNASKKSAWYSEEYQNCGNGHYYLALDESMAVFAEDD